MPSITEIGKLSSSKEIAPQEDEKKENWKMGINWTKEEEEEFEPLPINTYSFPYQGTNQDPLSQSVSNRNNIVTFLLCPEKTKNLLFHFCDSHQIRTQILHVQIKLQKLNL